MVNTEAAEIVYDSRIVRKQRGKLSEMVLVVGLIIIVDDNMGVEDWFDESGKNRVSLTTSDEALRTRASDARKPKVTLRISGRNMIASSKLDHNHYVTNGLTRPGPVRSIGDKN